MFIKIIVGELKINPQDIIKWSLNDIVTVVSDILYNKDIENYLMATTGE